MATLVLELRGQQAERVAKAIKRELKGVGTAAKGTGKDMVALERGGLRKVTTGFRTLTTVIGAMGLGLLARQIIKVGAAFEQLRAQLETVTGSARAANEAFELIKKFAADTPFQVSNLTEAFILLKAKGVDPTVERMRALGDLAAAFGKDILQAQQAVTGAMFGETEMLKQFGIILSLQGKEAKLTFQGMTQVIERDSESIRDALLSIAETNFAGAMERQMNTFIGATSNMQDAWESLLDTLAQSGSLDLAARAVRSVTSVITAMAGEVGNVIVVWEALNATILDAVSLYAKIARGVLQIQRSFTFLRGPLDNTIENLTFWIEILDEMAEERLGRAAAAINVVSASFTSLAESSGEGGGGLAAALEILERRMKEIESQAKVNKRAFEEWADALKPLLTGGDIFFGQVPDLDPEKVRRLFGVDIFLELMESGAFIPDEPPSKWDELTAKMADSFEERLGSAIAQGLASGDITSAMNALVGVFAAGISLAVTTATGNPFAGAFAGGLFAGAFGGGGEAEAKRLDRMKAVLFDLENRGNLVVAAFIKVDDILLETIDLGLSFGEALKFMSRALDEVRMVILGISTGGFGDRLADARQFNTEISQLFDTLRVRAEEDVRARFERGEIEGEAEFREELAGAIEQALAAVPDMIDLSALAGQLALEFAGVSFEFLSVRASGEALIAQFKELGLAEEELARLTAIVTDSMADQIARLAAESQLGILGIAERIGSQTTKTATKRFEIEKMIMRLDIERFRLQLKALGELDKFWRRFLRRLGRDLDALQIGDLRVPGVSRIAPVGRIGRGGRRRDALQEFVDRLKGAVTALIHFREELVSARQSTTENFLDIQKRFFGLAVSARGGDIEALEALPAAGRELTSMIDAMFGGTAVGRALLERMTSALDDIFGEFGIPTDPLDLTNDLLKQILEALRSKNTIVVKLSPRSLEELKDATSNEVDQAVQKQMLTTMRQRESLARSTEQHLAVIRRDISRPGGVRGVGLEGKVGM